MDENMAKQLDTLVTERITYHSTNAPDERGDGSLTALDTAYKSLFATLNPEQKSLEIVLENHFSQLSGRVEQFYFRVGLSDGIAFVMGILQK
jgi:hypothetical protein